MKDFTSIVTKIYAEQNGDITFCLLGELQLRMEVKLWHFV